MIKGQVILQNCLLRADDSPQTISVNLKVITRQGISTVLPLSRFIIFVSLKSVDPFYLSTESVFSVLRKYGCSSGLRLELIVHRYREIDIALYSS